MARSTRHDPHGLDGVLRRQSGLILRQQALACGLTPEALRRRIRAGGPWQRLLPGVYLSSTGAVTVRQQETAALLYAGPDSVMTGLAALRRWGLRTRASSTITVLVPARRPRRSHAFVVVRPTTRMPMEGSGGGPVRFASPPRAVADAAREVGGYSEFRALVADAVQRGLCPLDWLNHELREGPMRHSAWLRQALAEVEDGIRSSAEGDLRDLIRKARLPAPLFNARLCHGRALIAVADAWWPGTNVVAEVDSREWHLAPDDWERTLSRHARMGAHGLVVLHFTPRQLRDKPAMVAAAIRGALAAARPIADPAFRAVPAR